MGSITANSRSENSLGIGCEDKARFEAKLGKIVKVKQSQRRAVVKK